MSIRINLENDYLSIIIENYLQGKKHYSEFRGLVKILELKYPICENNDEDEVEIIMNQYFEEYHDLRCDILESESNKCSLICIVFTIVFLESYIYSYATENMSANYVKKHLDKLDLISKMQLIPRLVVNKELEKGIHSMQLLNEIIKMRNKIIHSKSREFKSMEELKSKYDEVDIKYVIYANKCIKLVKELTADLNKLDPKFKIYFEDIDTDDTFVSDNYVT